MIKIDFHVHTSYSPDSLLPPEKLAKKSHSTGIIPGVADHNTLSGFPHLKELGAEFVPALEINTEEGHLVALHPTELIPRGLSFGETLDRIKEQGALAYLPHMYDSMRHGVIPKKEDIGKIDILEVFNSRCLFREYNEKAAEFAKKHRIAAAAGSDAHSEWEFGRTYTKLPDFDITLPKELLKALKSAKIVGKATPFYRRYSVSIATKTRKLLGLWKPGK